MLRVNLGHLQDEIADTEKALAEALAKCGSDDGGFNEARIIERAAEATRLRLRRDWLQGIADEAKNTGDPVAAVGLIAIAARRRVFEQRCDGTPEQMLVQAVAREVMVEFATLVEEGRVSDLNGQRLTEEAVADAVAEVMAHYERERLAKRAQEQADKEAKRAAFAASYGTYTNPATGKRLTAIAVRRVLDAAGTVYNYTERLDFTTTVDGQPGRQLEAMYVSCNTEEDANAAREVLEAAGYMVVRANGPRFWVRSARG